MSVKTPTTGPSGRRAGAVRYGVSVAASGAAWLLSLVLAPLIDPGDLPLFLGAVMLSAWYGGLGPGLVAACLGTLAGTLALVPGNLDFPAMSPTAIARLGIFAADALVITSLSAALHAARRRAETLATAQQAARAEAETAAARIRNLQRVTDTALANLTLDDLLRELIGRVREALGADTVVILLLTEDGSEVAVRASIGLEDEVREGVRIPVGRGIAGRIAVQREVMLFDDFARLDIASPILRAKGLRSLLGAPLVADGVTLGVVHVGALSAREWTADDRRLLALVADRIATAVDRARVYEAERSARAAAQAAERRFRLLVDGVADYATYMLDPAGRVVSWNAGAERLKGYAEAEVLDRNVALFYTAEDLARGAPAQALEVAAAEGRHEGETWRVRKDGSRFWADVLVTSLRDDEGRLFGYAVVTHDLTERKRATEIRARLLDQVIAAQEDEQRRIARELHDETGQSLTSLLVGLRTLADAPSVEAVREQAADLRQLTARTLDEVRRLARGLRPTALDELGLAAALETHALEYGQSRGIAVDIQTRGLDGLRMPPAAETALYRIIQEALTNIAKHAGARNVGIVVQRQPGRVWATVTDDGCGFDVAAALRTPGAWSHLGLHGMRERAALLDGSVTIESAPGEGTTIYVQIPLAGAVALPEAGGERVTEHGED